MTVSEIDKLFEVDSNGCFLRLVLPEDKLGEAVNLIGQSESNLSTDLIIRLKKYAGKLYEEAIFK